VHYLLNNFSILLINHSVLVLVCVCRQEREEEERRKEQIKRDREVRIEIFNSHLWKTNNLKTDRLVCCVMIFCTLLGFLCETQDIWVVGKPS